MTVRILIDGYNLLFASSVFASAAGPPTLERTRLAFLQFLSDVLTTAQRKTTLVVFDAAQAPPGLPHEMSVAGMHIRFSRKPQHADDLLEDLIDHHKQPRILTVVSSDHRIQRAARQKGATYLDSETWLQEMKQHSKSNTKSTAEHEKPDLTNWESAPELQAWQDTFAIPPEQLRQLKQDAKQILPQQPLPRKKLPRKKQ